LTTDKPKTLISINGKSILNSQIEALNSNGIGNISVVVGYKSEAFMNKDIKLIKNDNYEDTSELESLKCASSQLSYEGTIITYGDLLFKRYIIEQLINCDDDFTIVVSQDTKTSYNEYVKADKSCSSKNYGKKAYAEYLSDKYDNSAKFDGIFTGIMMIKGKACDEVYSYLNKDKSYSAKDRMINLINHIIKNTEVRVRVLYIQDDSWSDINTLASIQEESND
jgi:phosphoenolpyruvate phosphomutase